MTPADIARGLSPAQRSLLLNFPDGTGTFSDWLGIVWRMLFDPYAEETLTPLGLAVRAELEKMGEK